jgi:cyclophilin family peptidyl-prolyl cis-trans isomerase
MSLRALTLALTALTVFGADKPQVKFSTSLGAFTLELEPEAAPRTVANFLGYVKSGHFRGTLFHRVKSNFMIQGGGVLPNGGEKPGKAPIRNEAKEAAAKGVTNVRGAVAMARTTDPHSATAQFFINVADNAFLDMPDQSGWGYCAFGHVISGMDTVDKIRTVQTRPTDWRPLTDILITGATVVNAPKSTTKKSPRK